MLGLVWFWFLCLHCWLREKSLFDKLSLFYNLIEWIEIDCTLLQDYIAEINNANMAWGMDEQGLPFATYPLIGDIQLLIVDDELERTFEEPQCELAFKVILFTRQGEAGKHEAKG